MPKFQAYLWRGFLFVRSPLSMLRTTDRQRKWWVIQLGTDQSGVNSSLLQSVPRILTLPRDKALDLWYEVAWWHPFVLPKLWFISDKWIQSPNWSLGYLMTEVNILCLTFWLWWRAVLAIRTGYSTVNPDNHEIAKYFGKGNVILMLEWMFSFLIGCSIWKHDDHE